MSQPDFPTPKVQHGLKLELWCGSCYKGYPVSPSSTRIENWGTTIVMAATCPLGHRIEEPHIEGFSVPSGDMAVDWLLECGAHDERDSSVANATLVD